MSFNSQNKPWSKFIRKISNYSFHVCNKTKSGSDILLFPENKTIEYCNNNNLKPIVINDYINIDEIFLKVDENIVVQTYVKYNCFNKYLDILYKQLAYIEINSFYFTYFICNNDVWIMCDIYHNYSDLNPSLELQYFYVHTDSTKLTPTLTKDNLILLNNEWFNIYTYFSKENKNISMTVMKEQLEGNLFLEIFGNFYKIQIDNNL